MLNKFISLIKRELKLLLISLLLTITAFILLAVWRMFDSDSFTFHQIIVICLLLGIIIYLVTFFGRGRISKALFGKELAVILFIFTVLSFLILNVDRSRSVYLLKWVQISSSSGTTSEDLSNRLGFSRIEKTDFEQRIDEQIKSGTLKIDGDKIKLTPAGSILTKFFDFLAKFENLKGYPSSWQ